jgi:hypothetical protein
MASFHKQKLQQTLKVFRYEPTRLEVKKAVTATETGKSGTDAVRWAEKVVRGL